MARKLVIRWTKSASGHKKDQVDTVRALGLRKLQHTVEHNDTPQIRGMVFKVRHLVSVTEA
jgi:large subunit ribosomal protein L30